MRQEIINILNSFVTVRKQLYMPTKIREAAYVEKELPNSIINKLNLNMQKYVLKGSVGNGKWTETPWVSIFDKEITTTAQKGFYIVYLFKKDMSGVYISLNQGTTYIDKKYKGLKPREKMKKIANIIREDISFSDSFSVTDIDLISVTQNAKNYMAAHICGKYYSLLNLPSDEELQSDLKELLAVYSELKELIKGRTFEETLDYYLQKEEIEDTQFQSDVLVAPPTTTPRKPQSRPERNKAGTIKETWKRDPSRAKEALENASYLCQIDSRHHTFKSEVTGKNFVEAHHFIPMKVQGQFESSLDVPGNIISLCPNCHRMIHHAIKKDRMKIVQRLFSNKQIQQSLLDFGINVSLNDVYRFYS